MGGGGVLFASATVNPDQTTILRAGYPTWAAAEAGHARLAAGRPAVAIDAHLRANPASPLAALVRRILPGG